MIWTSRAWVRRLSISIGTQPTSRHFALHEINASCHLYCFLLRTRNGQCDVNVKSLVAYVRMMESLRRAHAGVQLINRLCGFVL